MTVHFLDIPPEILVKILCFLDPSSITSCSLAHCSLHTCIRDHQIVQYHVVKQVAGVEDNPHCTPPFSVSDRLAYLRSREEGWAKAKIDFRRKIRVTHNPSGIYDVGGGIYLMGNGDKRTLHFLELPKTEREAKEMRWKNIKVEKNLIDMALGIYEHDLIAVVTTTPSANHSQHVFEIHLLQFSTGKPHPLAKSPVIRVSESQWQFPSLGMEIVGNHLALILTHHSIRSQPDDSFYIFDWKEGILKLSVNVPFHTYSGLVFLSPSIVLLPNMSNNTLDFWAVPLSTEARTVPLACLGLPMLGYMHFIINISCRGEPNPVGSEDGFRFSNEPFHAKWEDAIVIFNVRIQKVIGNLASYTLSFFAHRKTLLGFCFEKDGLLPPLPPPEPIADADTDTDTDTEMEREAGATGTAEDTGYVFDGAEFFEFVEAESDDEDSDSDYVDAEEDSGMDVDSDAPSSPTLASASSSNSVSTPAPAATASTLTETETRASALDVRPPVVVPWMVWGPRATRWFHTDDIPTRWITTSAGQRCVVYSEGDGRQVKPSLTLFDFNVGSPSRPARSGSEPSEIRGEMFVDPVSSSLPFETFTLRDLPVFDGVLMDEERLLGLRANEDGRIVEVEVMHIGTGERRKGNAMEWDMPIEDNAASFSYMPNSVV